MNKNIIDPTDGLIKYIQEVKPYHTNIFEVDIEYVYEEIVNVVVNDLLDTEIEQTTTDIPVISSCGWGIEWDPVRTVIDYPSVCIRYIQGHSLIDAVITNYPTSDITILNNYDNYKFQIGETIRFEVSSHTNKAIFPNTTSDKLDSLTMVTDHNYYVSSVSRIENKTIFTIKTSQTSPNNIEFTSSGVGTNLVMTATNLSQHFVVVINDLLDNPYELRVDDLNFNITIGSMVRFGTDGMLFNTTTDVNTSTGIEPNQLYVVSHVSNDNTTIRVNKSNNSIIDDNPIVFTNAGIGKLSVIPSNINQNSFVVDQEVSPLFSCVLSSTDSSLFTFVRNYNIVSISAVDKRIEVQGNITSVAIKGSRFYIRNNTSSYSDTLFTIVNTPDINGSGNTELIVKEGISIKSTNTGYVCFTMDQIPVSDAVNLISFNTSAKQFIVEGDVTNMIRKGQRIPVVSTGLVQPLIVEYTVNNNPVLTGSNTSFTVVEPIHYSTTNEGVVLLRVDNPNPYPLYIDDPYLNVTPYTHFWPTPRWERGTLVSLTVLGTDILETDCYFIPTEMYGQFKLSKVRYPLHPADYYMFDSSMDHIITISRAESFYPGATVLVSESVYAQNNGYYTITQVTKELVCGVIKNRVFVHEHIPYTTSIGFNCETINDLIDTNGVIDGKMSLISPGWDHPTACPLVQADEFYTDTVIHEHLMIETEEAIYNYDATTNEITILGDYITSHIEFDGTRKSRTGILSGNPIYIRKNGQDFGDQLARILDLNLGKATVTTKNSTGEVVDVKISTTIIRLDRSITLASPMTEYTIVLVEFPPIHSK